MRADTNVARGNQHFRNRFFATVAVDRENIAICPVALIRTTVRFHCIWSKQAEGSLACRRELTYKNTHTHIDAVH